ncbi:hypothetical protein LMZ02_14040 [Paenibacillus macerans]|nr:hypothetical protein [Paenibacillus macerans]UMV50395.1 hypothetical protein LMZ02_14040 [Paenibacillus macerans]
MGAARLHPRGQPVISSPSTIMKRIGGTSISIGSGFGKYSSLYFFL